MKSDPSSKLLLESIRVQDGVPELLAYHQRRVDRCRKVLYPKAPALKLQRILETIPLPQHGVHKLRLEYGEKLAGHEILPYDVTSLTRLRIVDADHLRYGKKYADRAAIRELYTQRGDCDDVLMVQRGHVTDTSYANVALYDGSNWYTPAWPLLRGTRREWLLENGTLRASVIRERDLHHFEKLRLINAMLPWGTGPEIPLSAVVR